MAWWVPIVVLIAGQVLYEVLRPKTRFTAPTPSSLGDFTFPTIGEGRTIPILWGTCIQHAPMVVYYGEPGLGRPLAEPVTEWVRTGWFTGTRVTLGYRYRLAMDLVLCSGQIDEVLEIRFDNKIGTPTATLVGAHSTTFTINKPDLFGGAKAEGGIDGDFAVYHGTPTQPADLYLSLLVGNLPGYRNVAHLVVVGADLGMVPTIKPIAVVMRRTPNALGLSGGDHNIGGDANPAAMIYDLLTSSPSNNGLGIATGVIDVTALRAMGATLADESMGLSILQDQTTTARELLLEILRHVDGLLYVEPFTGLLTGGLVRFDYDPNALEVLDETNCTVTAFDRPAWNEVRNTIRVAFVDRAGGFQERTVQAQNLAAIEAQGGEVSVHELPFRGFSTAANAQRAAARALAAIGYPLATVSIRADRSAWNFRPGTVRRLNWPALGIVGMVVRVAKVKHGDLESGAIELELMEDVFSVDWTGYAPPPATAWQDPAGPVQPLTAVELVAAPYPFIQGLTPGPEDLPRAIAMAARGTGITVGVDLEVEQSGGGYGPPEAAPAFTPSGLLDVAIDEVDATIDVLLGPDLGILQTVDENGLAEGQNLALLGTEWIAFQTVTPITGGLRLGECKRGVIDTVPEAHAENDRVWIPSYGHAQVGILPPPAATDVRFTAFNSRSRIASGSAPVETIAADDPDRALRPYPPTAVTFNGVAYPVSISGELTVAWSHRNRLGTWSYANSGATATAEPGTEYDVLVYGELGTLVHTEAGLTGTSWTYLEADEIAESGLGRLNDHLRVKIRTFGAARTHVAIREIEWEVERV